MDLKVYPILPLAAELPMICEYVFIETYYKWGGANKFKHVSEKTTSYLSFKKEKKIYYQIRP